MLVLKQKSKMHSWVCNLSSFYTTISLPSIQPSHTTFLHLFIVVVYHGLVLFGIPDVYFTCLQSSCGQRLCTSTGRP
jgi:hypothetical protein